MQKGEFFVEKGGKKLAEKKGETKKRRKKKMCCSRDPNPRWEKLAVRKNHDVIGVDAGGFLPLLPRAVPED